MTEQQQEQCRLIELFQTVSANEGSHLRADRSAISDQYNQKLSALIASYGHDETTHGYIMMSLDALQDRKTLQTVRGIAQQVVHQACELKKQHPAGSPQAQGYANLEARVAHTWRFLMMRDNATPMLQRQMEYKNIEANSPSAVLKEQLPRVVDHVYGRYPQPANRF